MTSIAKKTEAMTAAAQNAPAKTLRQLVKQMEPEIKKALPSFMSVERYLRELLTALSSNPQLGACTPNSFLCASMTAAQLGLEVNVPALGQAYLIPYRNGKTGQLECQFQIGYKGLIDLAYRSGKISTVSAEVVYENDEFEYELGLEPKLKHKPAKSDRGNPVFYYATFHTKDGGYGFEVMSVDDIKAHRDRFCKSASFSPWSTNFDEMAKKTVLKRVLKYAPLSTDFAHEVSTDGSVKTTMSEDMYAEPDAVITAEFTEETPAEE